MAVNFGDVPTWVAAIGTVGTLVAALSQISNERKRRLSADEQLRIAKHLEQARLVAAYMGEQEKPEGEEASLDKGRTAVYLTNNSPEPVYSVVVGIVFLRGAGPKTLEELLDLIKPEYGGKGPVTTVSIVPTGLYRVWIRGTGWAELLAAAPGMLRIRRVGVDVAFTDRAGAHWIRRATGQLQELDEPPMQYFALLPATRDWQTPERVPS